MKLKLGRTVRCEAPKSTLWYTLARPLRARLQGNLLLPLRSSIYLQHGVIHEFRLRP
jgi:hypothetical protein